MPSHGLWRFRTLLPSLLLLAICLADVSLNRSTSLASLVVMVPLVAASLVTPRATLGYGALAFVVWWALSWNDQLLSAGVLTGAAIVRGVAVLLGTSVAVCAAVMRARREQRLHDVLRVAEVAQQSILRPMPERISGMRLAARYGSSMRDATVGGDLYEAMDTPWGVRIVIGDVRGKGLDAVRLAADVLGAFREWSAVEPDLADLLERLNTAAIRRAAVGDFVTALIVELAPDGACSVVSAGHPAPALIGGGLSRLLPLAGARPPLVFEGRAQIAHRQLYPGDQLVLYTDGVTESRRRKDREFFDDDRLLSTVEPCVDVDDTVEALTQAVDTWTDGRVSDDFAIVGVQYAPADMPMRAAGAATPATPSVSVRVA